MVTKITKIIVGVPSGNISAAAAGNASTLGGESSGYYTDFTNLNNVPTILDSNAIVSLISSTPSGFDSSDIAALIASTVDSNYVGIRLDDQILRFVNKSHIDGLGINAAEFNGESASYYLDWANLTNVPVELVMESELTAAIDSAINSVIGLAPDQLNTLNELAEAIGDDANFVTTITNLTNTKLDTAQTINLIDSAYVSARIVAGSTFDSGNAIGLIDSAYINARVDQPPVFNFDSAIQDITTNIIPRTTEAVDLGTNTQRFRDLYLSGNSIMMGSLVISDSGGTLVIKDNSGNKAAISLAATTTKELIEEFNLFYTRARVDSDFDARLLTKTTADLAEGDNLYYTTARADSAFDARFDSSFDERLATKTTTNIVEGDNLYYTRSRFDSALGDTVSQETIRNYFSAAGDLSYNSASGEFSFDVEHVYTQSNFDSDFNTSLDAAAIDGLGLTYNTVNNTLSIDSAEFSAMFTTENLPEGNNLYYTSARVDSDILSLVDAPYIQSQQAVLANIADRNADAFGGAGVTVTGDIIPDGDTLYNLGSPDRKFAGLYVAGETIYIGNLSISDATGEFIVKSVDSAGTETTILKQETGAIYLKDFAIVDSGEQLFLRKLDSDNRPTTDFADLAAGTATLAGALRGPSQFVIDPYPYAVDSGEVIIRGNLRVEGTTTTINSTNLSVNDKLIIIADSSPDAISADGAGFLIDGAGASLTYNASLDKFVFNKGIVAPTFTGQYLGFDSDFDSALSTKSTTDLAEGDNLYYTAGRVDSDILSLVDATYIRARQDDIFRDSAFILNVIDSDFVNSKVAIPSGSTTTLGAPVDGNVNDGAFTGFDITKPVVEAIDHLNEALNNVRNNTFVRSVSFTGSPTAGGAGTNVTLNLNVDGTPNRYDVYWGDGSVDSATSDATPSHVYATNAGSPYTVTVRAYNNGGYGSGMEASSTLEDYIIIYTADPSVAFRLYKDAVGGSPLSGNNLYVIEGGSLYLENITTNTTGADVTYTMNWADGNVDTIASDIADGGVNGNRLLHQWQAGSNSGSALDALTLTLTSHTTALPSSIPTSGAISLKVYDDNPASPQTLANKTIALNGQDAKLAANVTNNTSTTTITAGANIERFISSNATTTTTSTFAYNNKSGYLVAYINDASDGGADMSAPINNADNGALVITDSSDFNLLSSTGSSISFNSSIYYPKLFDGFIARITKPVADLPTGINNMFIKHEGVGQTNTVTLVKDDLTVAPSISTVGNITETAAGTLKYISGIPYYTTNATLTLSGTAISNLIGQTYTDLSDVVSITSGTNLEGTSNSVISTQNYNYSGIDGAVTMLSGGIPIKETGVASPYSIGSLNFTVGPNNVRAVETLKIRARNINGTSSYSNLTENIQVYSGSISGIDETNLSVGAIGGTYSDNAIRIFDFSSATTDTPTIPTATNFYTNNTYSQNADPGVEGTLEATVRWGNITNNAVDYSTYLPAGPDRSNDTGDQYFTFAFRRTAISNFNININASNGISGLYIAAPGTQIDNTSTINGWLDASISHEGVGIPGAGAGGNGSNGCTVGTLPPINGTAITNGVFTTTLGTESLSDATNNVALVRIKLSSGQTISSLSIS